MWTRALWLVGLTLAAPAQAERPLSAIDWLNEGVAAARPDAKPAPILREPPVARSATAPAVAVTALDDDTTRATGLLPARVTGLPESLWRGSDGDTIVALLRGLGIDDNPPLLSLLYTLLLAETLPPATGAERLLLARIDTLVDYGAVEPAHALAERAGLETPDLFRRWFDLSLLLGQGTEACRVLADAPHLARDFPTRIFCAARTGDWSRSVTLLNTAEAFGDISKAEADLLAVFLDPELAEESPTPPAPDRMTPLDYRMLQALGEPVPTASLPRAYAVIDLSGDAGWKAQIEAAERLARVSALPENRLLGIYTDRIRSASGGVWERVEGLQRFDTALASGDPQSIARSLLRIWPLMQNAGLAAPFAGLFGERLAGYPMTGAAAEAAAEVVLLSPAYETIADRLPAGMAHRELLAAVARGQSPLTPQDGDIERAVAAGFAPLPDMPDLRAEIAANRLGEAILSAMALFARGVDGNAALLTSAIQRLRALGLEDTARRATLYFLVMRSSA